LGQNKSLRVIAGKLAPLISLPLAGFSSQNTAVRGTMRQSRNCPLCLSDLASQKGIAKDNSMFDLRTPQTV
jgi:hypothetical protein